MKHIFLIWAVVAALSLSGQRAFTAEPGGAGAELKDLVTRINAKLKAGANTEGALSGELKEFDALLAKHKGEKTDEAAQILYMKSMLYFEVFSNSEKGLDLMAQLKHDFPETSSGQEASQVLAQNSLAEGKTFPDFNELDVAGKPLSIAKYKGKVVLVDFWATWCPPCLGELPNVISTYEKYHGSGFEIVGISLDEDKERLTTFIKQRKMLWPRSFDGQRWGNKLAQKYVVTSIPATFLLDGDGKIIAKNLRGEALGQAVAKALAKKHPSP